MGLTIGSGTVGIFIGVLEGLRLDVASFGVWLLWVLGVAMWLGLDRARSLDRFDVGVTVGAFGFLCEAVALRFVVWSRGDSVSTWNALYGDEVGNGTARLVLVGGFLAWLTGALIGSLAGVIAEVSILNWRRFLMLVGFGLVLSHHDTVVFITSFAGIPGYLLVVTLAMISCAAQLSESPPTRWPPQFQQNRRQIAFLSGLDYEGLLVGLIGGSIAATQALLTAWAFEFDRGARNGTHWWGVEATGAAAFLSVAVLVAVAIPISAATRRARWMRERFVRPAGARAR